MFKDTACKQSRFAPPGSACVLVLFRESKLVRAGGTWQGLTSGKMGTICYARRWESQERSDWLETGKLPRNEVPHGRTPAGWSSESQLSISLKDPATGLRQTMCPGLKIAASLLIRTPFGLRSFFQVQKRKAGQRVTDFT